jgi:hypothetical protein
MSKLVSIQQNVSVANGAGLTFNPLLVDPATGAAVAPDICIPVPKATGSNGAVTSAMAVGNITVVQGAGGPIVYDILTIRLASMLRLVSAFLVHPQTISRFFVIANGGNAASVGAVYADAAILTNLYSVVAAKVAGDGATILWCERMPGGTTDSAVATGTLNLISGTGNATIAWLSPGILFPKYANIQNAVSVPNGGGGLTVHPGLSESSQYIAPPSFQSPCIIPDIVIPVEKALPAALTNRSFVSTVLAGEPTGLVVQTAEAAPVSCDILSFSPVVIQRLIAAQLGLTNDRRRYFVIANATNASMGAVYSDNAIAANQYIVEKAKVSGDGSTLLTCIRIAPPTTGADSSSATGTLNLVSGTGDATIGWLTPGIKFEKYMDVRQNVAVPNGAGLTFDPQLVVNGVPVMPDIVIPIPKATATVPFVTTDLTGAVGTVNVQHQNGAPQNCDILSIKFLSLFTQ